jgi:hypothetical protein
VWWRYWSAAALGWLIYFGYEVLLPISLNASHGISASTWGILAIIAPTTLVLFQMRVVHALREIDPPAKLIVALLLMGTPFLLLRLDSSLVTGYAVSRWEARCERCAQPVAFIVPASDSLGRHLPQFQAKRPHDERD